MEKFSVTDTSFHGRWIKSSHDKDVISIFHSAEHRKQVLDQYNIMNSPEEQNYSDIVQLAAQTFGVAYAAISFLENHTQWFKATVGLDLAEPPLDKSFCKHTMSSDLVMVVNDARCDLRFAYNPLVVSGPKVRFYAGLRLLAHDGTPLGAICVFDSEPRHSGITEAENLALRMLAAQVQTLLELRRSLRERDDEIAKNALLADSLHHAANFDPLTNLPHRRLFQQQLDQIFAPNGGPPVRTALVVIDIDHFKQVNDGLGHAAGDAVLCAYADRLRSIVREGDCVARLGGDEFGILVRGIGQELPLAELVSSLSTRFQQPLSFQGRQIECSASLGVAIYPDDARSADGLAKSADLALTNAKSTRGCVVFFKHEMEQKFARQSAMLAIAEEGLATGSIVPFYQPKVDLRTQKLVGFEALARRLMPGQDALSAESFSHAFNDSRLAHALGLEIMTRVLDDVKSWSASGVRSGSVAVNACAADFRSDDFAERLIAGLEERGLLPDQIEIEVTESVFLGRGADYVLRALWLLHRYGVRIALDDFGTGYASLTHLKKYPVDSIKIDRSFVAGIGRSGDDTCIVKALTELAQNLGIETIAEGVELFQQREFLSRIGCDIGQGFIFGAAIPAADVPEYVETRAIGVAA